MFKFGIQQETLWFALVYFINLLSLPPRKKTMCGFLLYDFATTRLQACLGILLRNVHKQVSDTL